MRNVIPLIIILSICSTAWAQTTITAGPQLDMPSNFSKASKISLGGSAEGVFNVSSVSAIRVSAGYYSFKGKFFPEIISFVPVRGGYQYFLSPNQLYVYGEGGPSFYNGNNYRTKLSLAFGGGTYFPTGKGTVLNISLFFNYVDGGTYRSHTWFSGRLAYGLQWGGRNSDSKKNILIF